MCIGDFNGNTKVKAQERNILLQENVPQTHYRGDKKSPLAFLLRGYINRQKNILFFSKHG